MSDVGDPEISLQAKSPEEKTLFTKRYFTEKYRELHETNPSPFEWIRKYKSDAYYIDTNGVARQGEKDYLEWLISRGQNPYESTERVRRAAEIASEISHFLRSSTTPTDITVYRAISGSTIQRIRDSGGKFVDNGFVSTCFTKADAIKYHKLGLIRIIAPKGTRAIDMTSALKFTDWAAHSEWENELTIDRGYSYKVDDVPSDDCALTMTVDLFKP